jgi:hypothetical protein
VSTALKAASVFIKSYEIRIDLGPTEFYVSSTDIKKIYYSERHFLNGAEPLSTVTITVGLSDGGMLRFTYQIIGFGRA